jgi:SPP1 family predicted phage head-tail adaptor
MTMSPINVGDLRHSVTIEQPVKTSDGQGGFTRSWSTYFTGFAHIEPLSARERLFSNQKTAETSHKITMRYRMDKLPTIEMRVNYTVGSTTRIFQISGVINTDERNRYMTLMCKEGVGA